MDDLTMSALSSQFIAEAKLHLHFSNELPWEIHYTLQSLCQWKKQKLEWADEFISWSNPPHKIKHGSQRLDNWICLSLIMCSNCTW